VNDELTHWRGCSYRRAPVQARATSSPEIVDGDLGHRRSRSPVRAIARFVRTAGLRRLQVADIARPAGSAPAASIAGSMALADPPIMPALRPSAIGALPAECTSGPSHDERTAPRRPGCRDVLPEPFVRTFTVESKRARSTGPTRRWTVPECARIPAWGIAPMCRSGTRQNCVIVMRVGDDTTARPQLQRTPQRDPQRAPQRERPSGLRRVKPRRCSRDGTAPRHPFG
jgi:hypothetical protein